RGVAGFVAHLARRAGVQRSVLAVVTTFVAGATAVSVSLWLKLILDGVATGAVGRVTVLAAVLAVTVVLQAAASSIAGLFPAQLLLPVLALPSLYAGARAERVVDAANRAAAEPGRFEDHLFHLVTTSSPAKEVRIFGLGAEIVGRQRQAWDRVTDTISRAQL